MREGLREDHYHLEEEIEMNSDKTQDKLHGKMSLSVILPIIMHSKACKALNEINNHSIH